MGKVIKFGDNIDTDVIIPGKYISLSDSVELAKHCMEGYEKDFAQKISKGDIFVAGDNFGCGSSREHAPISIKASGVQCIIATSFARIFYRNSINIGLPVLESKEAAERINQGDECSVDFTNGIINDLTTGEQFKVSAYPKRIQEIIEKGGLMEFVKYTLNKK